jgi:hypothetical protein
MNGLNTINKNLPSAVYVPFVNSQMRNHMVLNIVVEETRMFLTKERAPFLICLEVFRPEEVIVSARKADDFFKQGLMDKLKRRLTNQALQEKVDKFVKQNNERLSVPIRVKDITHPDDADPRVSGEAKPSSITGQPAMRSVTKRPFKAKNFESEAEEIKIPERRNIQIVEDADLLTGAADLELGAKQKSPKKNSKDFQRRVPFKKSPAPQQSFHKKREFTSVERAVSSRLRHSSGEEKDEVGDIAPQYSFYQN